MTTKYGTSSEEKYFFWETENNVYFPRIFSQFSPRKSVEVSLIVTLTSKVG